MRVVRGEGSFGDASPKFVRVATCFSSSLKRSVAVPMMENDSDRAY
ncbi:MAG TPA: hypothetical protein VJK04_00705 [Candidatus Paceibacterota bacterium]